MILLPAIDLRGGHAVRLVQGDYERETVFDADPAEAARRWAEQGAGWLHVVDLDGARAGQPVSLGVVARIREAVGLPLQLGGGIRSADDVERAFAAGARRVVLGTAAIADPALVESLAAEHGERIAVAADARAGKVAVEGWARGSTIGVAQLVRDLGGRGVSRFVHTPVEVDGTLAGPRLEGLRQVAEAVAGAGAEWAYSGGVGALDDLRRLAAAELPALAGVVVGRALYEGRFSVAAGQAALNG